MFSNKILKFWRMSNMSVVYAPLLTFIGVVISALWILQPLSHSGYLDPYSYWCSWGMNNKLEQSSAKSRNQTSIPSKETIKTRLWTVVNTPLLAWAFVIVVISPLYIILQPFSHSGYLDPYSYWCSWGMNNKLEQSSAKSRNQTSIPSKETIKTRLWTVVNTPLLAWAFVIMVISPLYIILQPFSHSGYLDPYSYWCSWGMTNKLEQSSAKSRNQTSIPSKETIKTRLWTVVNTPLLAWAFVIVVISPLYIILQPFSHSGYLDPYSYWCSWGMTNKLEQSSAKSRNQTSIPSKETIKTRLWTVVNTPLLAWAFVIMVISPLYIILQPFSHSGYLDPYSYWCSWGMNNKLEQSSAKSRNQTSIPSKKAIKNFK